jgi:hypothetical protein
LPDGEHQITTGLFESHNGIQFIGVIGGVFDGKPWAMPTQHAIDRVEHGALRFFTTDNGKRAEVKVGNSRVASFLTTVSDDTKLNNLDVIVAHNPLRSDYTLWD